MVAATFHGYLPSFLVFLEMVLYRLPVDFRRNIRTNLPASPLSHLMTCTVFGFHVSSPLGTVTFKLPLPPPPDLLIVKFLSLESVMLLFVFAGLLKQLLFPVLRPLISDGCQRYSLRNTEMVAAVLSKQQFYDP